MMDSVTVETNNIAKRTALIFGVISSSMVQRGWSSQAPPDIQNIPLFSTVKDLIQHNWSLILMFMDNDGTESAAKVHVLQNNEFSPKQVKSILINEVAMTLKDLETIQESEIFKGVFHDQKIQLPSGTIILSIFASQSPSTLLIERVAAQQAPDHVVWSTCSCEDKEEDADALQLHFICPQDLSYQDFLIDFSKKHMGYDHQHTRGCRIEFEFFIYHNPVIFGKAICVSQNFRQNKSFYFSRVLTCAKMKKIWVKPDWKLKIDD